MGVRKAPKRKPTPVSGNSTERCIGAVKGKHARKHTDPYAGGERSGKRAKHDAVSAAANELARAAVPAPTVLAPPVLAPTRASPSGAVAGSAAGSFTCMNPSAAFPLNYAPSTTVPGLVFAPSSATIPGLGYTGDCTKSIFRAEIMPRNTLVRSRSSLGLRAAKQHMQRNTCFSNAC